VLVKQGADLHTSSFTQLLAARFVIEYDLDAHIDRIRGVYRRRCQAMLAALDTHMPQGVRYTRPAGGLFLWVELPEEIDARALLEQCLEENVAFVPGGAFFANGGHENTLRLNFSAMPEERVSEGVRRFGRVLAAALEPVEAV
jgi:DNA-binding transcriptional MocR family regulator